MAYLQLGVNPARADDTIDKAYLDGTSTDLLSVSTWETWLTDDWNTILGWFGSPTVGTTTQTSLWTTIINDIVNPLNAIETQANNVIVSVTHALTDIFSGIFGTTTPTSTTKVSAASVATPLGGASLNADLAALGTVFFGSPTVGSTIQVSALPLNIPQNNISGLVSSLASFLGTTTFQNLLDGIANAMGHTGTGHTVTDVETYLGLIPATNVTGTFPQSQITGLATALSNLLGTTTFQALLDGISNVMGHSGTGHTITDVETYLGIIPPANITNVLGGSNLGADVSSVNTTTTSHANWFTQILTALGLGGGSGTGTNIGGAISSAATTASGAASTASTTSTNLTNTWSWVFGTTTPTSSTPVQSTKVGNVLGGSSLGADVQAILDFVANGLGHTGTGHTLTDIETYLGLIPAANVSGTFPQSQITGLATALSSLLGTTTFQALLDGISNALGHSGTGHTVTQVETYLGLIPPTNVSNVLGGSSLGADLGALSTALYGGTSVASTVQVSAIPSGIPQNNISGLVTSLSSLLGTTTFQALLDGIANALGQSGTGHTVTQVETYLGIIPSGNVTGTFPQSQITGLATALSNLLGTTTFQSLLDGIANVFGHSGTGHTITDIETYLGIIPPANIANVLGGSSLAADVTSVSTTTTSHNTWFTQILSALGLSGGSGTGTNIAGAITTAQSTATGAASTASSASSAATTATTNVNNTWSWVFGTTTPTSSTPVLATKVASPLGGASLNADLTALGNLFFGSPTVGSTVQATALPSTLQTVNTNWGSLLTNLFSGGTIASTIQVAAIPSGVPATSIANVLGGASLGADVQAVLDYIANALGQSGTGHTLAQIETYLGLIPPTNVVGTMGPADIAGTLGTFVDALYQALSNTTVTGNSFGSLSNVLNQLSTFLGFTYAGNTPPSGSVADIAQNSSTAIANRAVTKPGYLAMDATADSVFPIAQISGASPTFVNLIPGTAVIGYIGTPDAGVKQSVIWLGQTTTNATAVYFTVYSVNTATGALTRLWTSANVLSSITNALGWNYYNMPSANYITSVQGDWFAVEMMIVGNGSQYQIAGLPSHWLPVNTAMSTFPQSLAASRAAVATATYSNNTVVPNASGTTTVTSTVSFTAPAGADVFVYGVAWLPGSSFISSFQASYGGVAMSSLGQVANDGSTFGISSIFRLAGSGTGSAKTISVTATAAAAVTVQLRADAVAVTNVGGVSSVATNDGSSSSASSGSLPNYQGNILFGGIMTASTIGSVTLTPTGSLTSINNQVSSGANTPAWYTAYYPLVTGSFTFTGTLSASTVWSGIAVAIYGTNVMAPSSISSPTADADVPWFGLGGAAGTPQYAPIVQEFLSSTTYNVPTGVQSGDWFDIVVLSGGGGGGAGSGSAFGHGGFAGAWTAITLQYGVDIPLSTTHFTVNVGNGGGGGISFTNGSNGGTTTVTITGYGTVSATGGAGGVYNSSGGPYTGASPGTETFGPTGPTHNTPYYGGNVQTISGAAGQVPGGAGAGGGFSDFGGSGASGAVWITAYQQL